MGNKLSYNSIINWNTRTMLSDTHMHTNLQHTIPSTIITGVGTSKLKINIGMAQKEGRQDRDGLYQ